MSHNNWLGGLTREIHHVKVMRDGNQTYEPTMVIMRHSRPGKSFMIPLDCLWRYVEMSKHMDRSIRRSDMNEFGEIVEKANRAVRNARLLETRVEAIKRLHQCADAEKLARKMGMLRSTAYSLIRGMEILEIPHSTRSAAQFHMFIQDRLDDLREFPEHDQNDAIPGSKMAEVVLKCGTKTVFDGEIPMTEADLLVPDEVVRN